MMLFGIPVYVCSTSSIPVAASLISAGVSPGAALVFLITGPATNTATIASIYKTMGKRVVGIYLATIVFSAFLSGYILDLIYSNYKLPVVDIKMGMVSGNFEMFSGVILAIVLILSLLDFEKKVRGEKETTSKEVLTFRVEGLSCMGCVRKVEGKLSELDNIVDVNLEFSNKILRVSGNNLCKKSIISLVENMGYSITQDA
jgi:copper chaperone CopZ